MRKMQAAAYAKKCTDTSTNVTAIEKAVAAMTEGISGCFLVNPHKLRGSGASGPLDADCQDLLAFVDGLSTLLQPVKSLAIW